MELVAFFSGVSSFAMHLSGFASLLSHMVMLPMNGWGGLAESGWGALAP
jgi:hypothetical protein